MEELINVLSQVGFPIVAYLLLFQLCKNSIEKNTNSTLDLKETIEKLMDKIDKR